MRVVTAAQMREIDRRAQEEFGIPSKDLMDAAGAALAAEVVRVFAPQCVAVVCGKGNNAGDGFVCARELAGGGVTAEVVCLAAPDSLSPAASEALRSLEGSGVAVHEAERLDDVLSRADVIVDAILGIGARGPLSGDFLAAVQSINASPVPVVAADVPSGTREAAIGESPGEVVMAALTVTFGLPKRPLLEMPFHPYAGRLVVASINFPPLLLEQPDIHLNYADDERLGGWLPARPLDGHKGTFGHVCVVGGAAPYSGAALLCAKGALRAGAGLATIVATDQLNPIFKAALPEAVTLIARSVDGGFLDETSAADIVPRAAAFDAMVIGPGLTHGPSQARLVGQLLAECHLPVVVDADALNCIADSPGILRRGAGRETIITPHPGELARLMDSGVGDIRHARVDAARDFAMKHDVIVVHKGACTVVARPNGQCHIVPGACPALAKGGTGDVLAGVIAGLAAQGMEPWKAAVAGVRLHLEAGRIAGAEYGERSVLAGEVADTLGAAFAEFE